MQLDLPFLRTPPEPVASRPADVPEPLTIDFVRMRRARRYILRVRPDGRVRVTIPRGGSRAEGLRFAQQHARWVQRERARVLTVQGPRSWTSGTTILLRGSPVTIGLVRAASLEYATYAGRRIRIPADAGDLRPFIERDLRVLAQAELVPRLRELAAQHSLTIGRISIRNQRSRWGSCSRRGDIALNYRLVQMPGDVSEYVLLHELMHITEPNHSRRFWRLVERVCPRFREAERWLKAEGRALF